MCRNHFRYLILSIFFLSTFHYAFSQHILKNDKIYFNNLCSGSWLSPGQPTIKNFRIWFKNRIQIENALWKMLGDSVKYNKKERWVEIILKENIVQLGDNRISEHLKNNYVEDNWRIKGFLFYFEPTKTFYWLSIYNCSEVGIGCSLCITQYFIDDGNHSLRNKDDKKERRKAVKTFKKKILPIIKKQIWTMRKYRP